MANPFQHNAKVIFIMGGKYFPVHECHDVHYALARKYVRENKRNPQFNGGKLLAVSMLQKEINLQKKKSSWTK